jgi:CRP-like cAMP-binding protein
LEHVGIEDAVAIAIGRFKCRPISVKGEDAMQPAKPASTVTAIPGPWAMNSLLAALPHEDFQRVSSQLTWRPLKARQVLHKHGEPISEVVFPSRSVCSITHTMEDGSVIEVAMVGGEGFVGMGAVLGNSTASGDAFVQVAGEPAAIMNIDAFRREMERRGPFYDMVTRYSQAFVALLTQSVACNGLHSTEERCCRWLLMSHDRIAQDEFALTHEFLAIMLGVRRPTVTLVMADLARAGTVSHVRGHVRIVDRDGLEAAACECYRNVRSTFDRLLPRTERVGVAMAR